MRTPSSPLRLALLLPLSLGAASCGGPGCCGPEVLDAHLDAVQLFDGETLEGWVGGTTFDPGRLAAMTEDERSAQLHAWTLASREHWRVEDGELVSDGQGPHLVTAADYGDFELELEFMNPPLGDSGIYLRGYPQVQIWDPGNERERGNGAHKGSGALWNNQTNERFPLALADNPPGEWNTLRIRMVGDHVWVWLNGIATVDDVVLENYFDRASPVLPRGPIHLQTHGSETRFRGLTLVELD